MSNEWRRESMRILVVEDHAQLRSMLVRALVAEGYLVSAVATGDEALERFQSTCEEPHIVVADVRMPGKTNGLELARWLRANRPQCKVLLQSGYSDVPTDEFPTLPKPYSDFELREALRTLLADDGVAI